MTFLTAEDESAFSTELVRIVPEIAFVDGCYWPTPEPPVKETISKCANTMVLLWNRAITPQLPSVARRGAPGYHGPQSGVVIQFIRSRIEASSIYSGSISVGWQLSTMSEFVKLAFEALDTVASSRVEAVNPATGIVLSSTTPGFRLGDHAAKWCLGAPGRYLRDQTISNFYKPRSGGQA